MHLANVNWLAVLVAAVAAWIFGSVYYTSLRNAWLAAQGKTMEQCKAENTGKPALQTALPFILSFVGEIIMGVVLFGILVHVNLFTVRAGAISGALCWFGFVLTTITINNAYTNRSTKLTTIDAVHWLGVLVIIGGILGWFGH
jgi:hypothetical protein